MPKLIDITGQRFGRLLVTMYLERSRWRCLCDCGQRHDAFADNLKSGQVSSCGCLRKELLVSQKLTHGNTSGGKPSPEYKAWTNMRSRCENPSLPEWPRYGGRGIKVCDEWRSDFAAFLRDMGRRPPRHELDRIDNNGDYTPENCRWATKEQQCNNRSTCIKYTAFGETKTLPQWARDSRAAVGLRTLIGRVCTYGWPIEAAITTPVVRRRRRRHFSLN